MFKLLKLTTSLLLGILSLSASADPVTPKDPTQPPAYEDTQYKMPSKDIKINAIFAGLEKPKAIIGKHVFEIGDEISDSIIIAIDVNGLTLRNKDGSEYRIEMNRTAVKVPAIKNRKET